MKKVFLFGVMVWVSSQATGVQPLLLDELLESVKQRYPLIAGAKKDVQSAQGELRSSEGSFDIQWKTKFTLLPVGYYDNERLDSVLEQPTKWLGTSFFAGYRLGVGKFPVYDGKSETNPGGELRLGFTTSLLRDGWIDRRRANIEKAKIGVEVSHQSLTQQMIDTVRLAKHRYWDWVVSGRRVAIYRTLLKIAQDRDSGLAQRVEHGDIPAFERNDNSRAILQRQSQLITAERTFQQASFELALYLRSSEGEAVLVEENRVPAKIPDPHPDEVPEANLEMAIAKRPDLVRLTALRSQNNIEVALNKNQSGPKLDFSVQGVQSLQNGSVTRNSPQLELGVFLEIPLQANVARGKEESAVATSMRIEYQEKLLKDRIYFELRDARSAIDTSLDRFKVTQQEVSLAKKMEEGERLRFNQGESNLLFVNLREQATVDAQIREIETLGEYRKALATMQAALAEF